MAAPRPWLLGTVRVAVQCGQRFFKLVPSLWKDGARIYLGDSSALCTWEVPFQGRGNLEVPKGKSSQQKNVARRKITPSDILSN